MLTLTPADKALEVIRAFTGPLGSWETTRPSPQTTVRPPLPPWSRLRPADIERFDRLRTASTAGAAEPK